MDTSKLIQYLGYGLLTTLIVLVGFCVVGIVYIFLGTVACLILSHFGLVDWTILNCVALGGAAALIRMIISRNGK